MLGHDLVRVVDLFVSEQYSVETIEDMMVPILLQLFYVLEYWVNFIIELVDPEEFEKGLVAGVNKIHCIYNRGVLIVGHLLLFQIQLHPMHPLGTIYMQQYTFVIFSNRYFFEDLIVPAALLHHHFSVIHDFSKGQESVALCPLDGLIETGVLLK